MNHLLVYVTPVQLFNRIHENLRYLHLHGEMLQQFIPRWNDSRQIPVRESSPVPQSSKSSAAPNYERSLISSCAAKFSAKVMKFESFNITICMFLIFIVIHYSIRRIPFSVFMLLTILLAVQILAEFAKLGRLCKRGISNFERMKNAYYYMAAYHFWSGRVGHFSMKALKSIHAVKNDLECLNRAKIYPETLSKAINTINEILARWSNRYKPVDHRSLWQWLLQAECLIQRFCTGLWLALDDEAEFIYFMRTTPVPIPYQLNGWEMENEEVEQCLLRISRAHEKNVVLSRELYKIFNQARVFSSRKDFLLDLKIRQL